MSSRLETIQFEEGPHISRDLAKHIAARLSTERRKFKRLRRKEEKDKKHHGQTEPSTNGLLISLSSVQESSLQTELVDANDVESQKLSGVMMYERLGRLTPKEALYLQKTREQLADEYRVAFES